MSGLNRGFGESLAGTYQEALVCAQIATANEDPTRAVMWYQYCQGLLVRMSPNTASQCAREAARYLGMEMPDDFGDD